MIRRVDVCCVVLISTRSYGYHVCLRRSQYCKRRPGSFRVAEVVQKIGSLLAFNNPVHQTYPYSRVKIVHVGTKSELRKIAGVLNGIVFNDDNYGDFLNTGP